MAMGTLGQGVGGAIRAGFKRWRGQLIGGCLVLLALLFIYNSLLDPHDRLISAEMLRHKWESERGAALRTALGLIAETPWLGRGFGFVEAYFSRNDLGIIGLGENVGHIFNSYLDIWLSNGVSGLLYALGLLCWAFGRHSLVSLAIVVFVFVAANTNPVYQSEYYYLFLGLAGAYKHLEERGIRMDGGNGCSTR
jgi:O-antigen ligase